MNYKRAIPSLVIGVGGVVALSIGLLHVMKIGTCASGNTPFVIANPCPSGTGSYILLVAGGIIAAVIAIMIGGFGGAGILIWGLLFLGAGGTMLVNALTAQGLSAGAKSAGYIVGGIFIPMGAVPVIWILTSGVGGYRRKRELARSKQADGTVTRVEELQRYGYNQVKARITYSVQPNDDASFEVTRQTNVLASQLPHTGQRVKIRYDPSNHDRFELVTANLVTRAGGTSTGQTPNPALASLAALTRAAAATPGALATPAVAGLPGVQGSLGAQRRDPLDRLKELTELRDAGALTATEFETQKAKILAET